MVISYARRISIWLGVVFVHSCTTLPTPPMEDVPAKLEDKTYTAFDGGKFEYLVWPAAKETKRVIIATHGICGINDDFKAFAEFAHVTDDSISIFAHNTRSQGCDPIMERRGDIKNPLSWYKDLIRFSELVRKKHPDAEIIWHGESMGAMITLNTYAHYLGKKEKICDRIILSSPVINIKQHVKTWQLFAVRIGAMILPRIRVPLSLLSDGQSKEITRGMDHGDDLSLNEYTLKSFTLRFLSIFEQEAAKMNDSIKSVNVPIAVFHGGNDFLSKKSGVEQFLQSSPIHTPKKFYHYPDAYHLILYDDLREKIFTDMLDWLNKPKTTN